MQRDKVNSIIIFYTFYMYMFGYQNKIATKRPWNNDFRWFQQKTFGISLVEQKKKDKPDKLIHTRLSGKLSDDKAGAGNTKLMEDPFIEWKWLRSCAIPCSPCVELHSDVDIFCLCPGLDNGFDIDGDGSSLKSWEEFHGCRMWQPHCELWIRLTNLVSTPNSNFNLML